MKNFFVTITGMNQYCGNSGFKIGDELKIVKDYDNDFDDEAIKVEAVGLGTVGYVANSVRTVYKGTSSAGRIYDKIGESAKIRVMFVTHTSIIAELVIEENIKTEQ
ncbi:MAG: DNA-binding protein [Ruminococcaceae bacterium]|nr:DNA-binding protein [Oscillospiraceae bacterium]